MTDEGGRGKMEQAINREGRFKCARREDPVRGAKER